MSDDGPDLSCFNFDDNDEGGEETPTGTLPQDIEVLMKRHRQEEQRLRTDAKAKKHSIPKGDRAARMAAEADFEAALLEMQQRHAKEMAAIAGGGVTASITVAAAGLSMGESTGHKNRKRQSKREKRESQERERERRIAEEKAAAGPSLRDVEMAKLTKKLSPLGLTVKEMAADGHCLYRSLADQLQMAGDGDFDFQACRIVAATYMRSHPDHFLPYLASESCEDLPSEELIAKHCAQIESTSEWGGQLEITAISHARRRCIAVHSADAPVILTGTEYDGDGPRLQLAYHRHYYGLGEHYNSLASDR
mmetsp:Transcript_11898/g.20066  ORF Transcript_11898/g.20066 Transcript_11898/m.20066 type:complete len:307 (+) Transcript_11898:61-981(+)